MDENEIQHLINAERDKEQQLVSQLLAIDAKIQKANKEIKKQKKNIQHITNSKTWNYARPIRKFLSNSSVSEEGNNYALQLEKLENSVSQAEREIKHIKLFLENNNHKDMMGLLKEVDDNGEIVPIIDDMIQQKETEDAWYRAISKFIAGQYKKKRPEYRKFIYSKLLSSISPKDIPEMIVRDKNVRLSQAASFRLSITMRAMNLEKENNLPEIILDNKQAAYSFIDHLSVRRPNTPKETYTYESIPLKKGMVIKPSNGAGSRGVYLVYESDDIVDVKRGEQLSSVQDLRESMRNDLKSNSVSKNEWMMEELIVEDMASRRPARDVKFYCFYGKVGLVLEIVRHPEVNYCWWDADGQRIRTGKYDDLLFKGKGFSIEEMELASSISREIPAPFIRIDFLRSADGLVFGEFTPQPGNYDDFNNEVDQQLGEYFVEAQARLMTDLLQGKNFEKYNELTKNGFKEF